MEPQEILQIYIDAIVNKDIDKLMSLYDEDVRQFDTWDKWEADKAQLRRDFEGWFEWTGEDHNHPVFKDVRMLQEEKLVVLNGYTIFTKMNPPGEAIESIKNRFTFVLIYENEVWKIWHEHYSIPVEMENLKGIYAGE
jgi:ketosteroid isomerase-like protein